MSGSPVEDTRRWEHEYGGPRIQSSVADRDYIGQKKRRAFLREQRLKERREQMEERRRALLDRGKAAAAANGRPKSGKPKSKR